MKSYPHMCRLDHDEVGWSGDQEECPVCREMNKVARLRLAIEEAIENCKRMGRGAVAVRLKAALDERKETP